MSNADKSEDINDLAASKRNLAMVAVGCIGFSQLIAYLCGCDTNMLHVTAGFTILVQLVVYTHASGAVFGNQRTEKFYDLTGSITYTSAVLMSAYTGRSELNPRQKLLSWLVIIWASRLGLFLFTRIVAANGEDSRFVRLKRNVYRFTIPWIIQGLWVFLTALPIFIINSNRQHIDDGALFVKDFVGLSIWILGFAMEVVADTEKMFWKRNSQNEGKYINTGLWSISRHPNYFGEMLLWAGFLVTASGSLLNIWQLGCAAISPLFVCTLLIKVSGITLLENAADKKWGDDAGYKKYKSTVPVLIPFIGRAGDAAF